MQIVVNGEDREVAEGIKIGTLLKELGIKEKTMASAVNMEVVKKDKWSTFKPNDGDSIEILQFVGGG